VVLLLQRLLKPAKDQKTGDKIMSKITHNRKNTGVHSVPLCGMLMAAVMFLATLSAAAGDSYQKNVLFSPHQSQLRAEAKGRVMIYDGLESRVVDRAMDEQFDRIDNMMFIRIRHASEDGDYYVEDDGC
jgi:hypothetical protein